MVNEEDALASAAFVGRQVIRGRIRSARALVQILKSQARVYNIKPVYGALTFENLYGAGNAEGVDEGRGLENCLRLLCWRVGVVEQCCARTHLGDAIDDADRTESEPRVDIAVKA